MKKSRIFIFILLLLFIVFISIYFIFTIKIKEKINDIQVNEDNNVSKDNTIVNNNTEENSRISEVDLLVNSLTDEQKVGQLFICDFRKDSNGNNNYILSDDVKNKIQKYNLGGVILFSENIENETQLKKYISDLNDITLNVPMYISVDCEGGIVDRLASTSLVSNLPYISKLGQTNDSNLSFEYGKIIGRRLAYFGFNLDFAPVCDLDNSDVIKYRSFGKDPNNVGKMVESYINGISQYNIATILKHFPGLGSSVGDTHTNISKSNISLEQLRKYDFIPFKYGLNANLNMVMINHVEYDNLSNIKLPASLNSDIYKLLRNELNFNGVIITDALNMEAITKQNINTSPAYYAFVSGADMLLMPQNIDLSYNEILNAVKSGKITESRLNDSVKRIIAYKYELGMFSKKQNSVNLFDVNDKKIVDEINNYKK